MKIEFTNKTKIPFFQVSPGQCFLDENNNVCLAGDGDWVVNLATGEMFELQAPDSYEVRLIDAKIVIE